MLLFPHLLLVRSLGTAYGRAVRIAPRRNPGPRWYHGCLPPLRGHWQAGASRSQPRLVSSMPFSWGLLFGGHFLQPCKQLSWASRRSARLQLFRLVKYSQLFSILRAGPKEAQLKKEEVGLDESQPWGMESVLFSTLDPGRSHYFQSVLFPNS